MPIPKLLQLARDNAAASKPVRAEVSGDGDQATIYLSGVIGGWWGDIDPTEFAKALAAITAPTIHLRVNSPGGDVFDARAMMTAIRQHSSKVIGHVDGLAASAATGVLTACDEVEISQGAFYMIHRSWTVAIGNEGDLITTAGLLKQIDATLAGDYVARTGKSNADVVAWMAAETWFSAEDAVKNGFCDRVVEVAGKNSAKAQAKAWNLAAYENAPKALIEPATENVLEQINALRAHNERRMALLERLSA